MFSSSESAVTLKLPQKENALKAKWIFKVKLVTLKWPRVLVPKFIKMDFTQILPIVKKLRIVCMPYENV